MNTEEDLQFRLLSLYPVKVIKEHFDIDGRQKNSTITEVTGITHLDVVQQFAQQNFSFTKQHVYLFSHKLKQLPQSPASLVPGHQPFHTSTNNILLTQHFFVPVEYEVFLTDPAEEQKINFYWPLKVTIDKYFIIAQFTILEKNIKSYINSERQAFGKKKNIEEEDIIEAISRGILALNKNGIEPLDINKGIKELWETDIIDSQSVRYKKDKSTSIETMDEEFLLKQDYPDEYKKIIRAPLQKTVFSVRKDTEKYGEHFVSDPTSGTIFFSKYSKKAECIENVIRKIIQHN